MMPPMCSLVLLQLSSLCCRLSQGVLCVVLILNLTKSIGNFQIGLLQATSIVLVSVLGPRVAKSLHFLPEKVVIVASIILELVTAHIYVNTLDPVIITICSVLSVIPASLGLSLSEKSEFDLADFLLRQHSKSQQKYEDYKLTYTRTQAVLGWIAQGIGAFACGNLVFHFIKLYEVEIEKDTDKAIKVYILLILVRLLLALFLTNSKSDRKEPRHDPLLSISTSDKTSLRYSAILDSLSKPAISQAVFSFYIFRGLNLFYLEIGTYLLYMNLALAFNELVGIIYRSSVRKRAFSYLLSLTCIGFLTNNSMIGLKSEQLIDLVLFAMILTLKQEVELSLDSPEYEASLLLLDRLLKRTRILWEVIGWTLCGLLFSLDQRANLMGYIVRISLVLRLVYSVFTFGVLRQGQFDKSTSKEEAFEGIEYLES